MVGHAVQFRVVLAAALELLLNQRNVLCLNRNQLFRAIRLRFAYNTLPTQRNPQNWLVREQLMEAIKANLLSHQIGSCRSEAPALVEVDDPGRLLS
jgi:hypothetical protein